MKKIINGKTYNTETAKAIGEAGYGSISDFGFFAEVLYRNCRGTWFLAGHGGPASKYSVSCGQNQWSWGSKIIPMTAEEAREWCEKNLPADEYGKIFGEEEASPSDLATRERVNVVLDTGLYAKLKAHRKETGIPVSRLLDRAIQQTYGF